MKKLLLLLLISIGLSGCGRDYKDIIEDLNVEYCKLRSLSGSGIALGDTGFSESKFDELMVEFLDEIESYDHSSSEYVEAAILFDSIQICPRRY